MVSGSCLCGKTQYRILRSDLNAYQCFCSLCRRQSGTASNLATIVSAAEFEWLSPVTHIQHWQKDTGFTSDFCSCCGSPVPNRLRSSDYVWIPLGTLTLEAPAPVVAWLCHDSAGGMETVDQPSVCFSDLPELSRLLELLGRKAAG